ncbi:LamG domain-containing protein [bacterium]|nr:LamG domain-containing protein [bacterium]
MKPHHLTRTPLALAAAMASLALTATSAQAATIAYRNLILSDSPVAYYQFDETSGTTALNSGSSGATQNGTHAGGTLTVGQTSAHPFLGTAYDFDGGFVTAAAIPTGLSEWTMEAWINTRAGSGTVLSNDAGGWNDDAIIGMSPEGGISGVAAGEFGISQQSAPGGPRDGVGATVASDEWHHVAMTGSASDSTMSVYIDGVLIASDTSPNVNFNFGTSAGLFIGSKRVTADSLFDGLIDEVAVYDSVLSTSDLAARANFNPIPEPTSAILGGMGALILLRRRRRD